MKSFLLLALFALSIQSAVVVTTYDNPDCSGSPNAASFTITDKCFALNATHSGINKVTSTGSYTSYEYANNNCNGNAVETEVTTFPTVCTDSGIGSVSNSFRVAPSNSDLVSELRIGNCDGAVMRGIVRYGIPCTNDCNTGTSNLAEKSLCGGGYSIPSSSSSASMIASTLAVVASIVLLL